MALESDLYAWVKTRPAIATPLGGATRPRFYFGAAPQAAEKPYTVWSVIYPQSHLHMKGVAKLSDPTLVLDHYAENGDDLVAIAGAADLELDGYRGLIGSTRVRLIHRTSLQDLPELRLDAGQGISFRRRGEYVVWYAP